jgi:hypothetical protein
VITSTLYGLDRKLPLSRLKLLQTHDVGFSGAKPVQEIGQSFANVVDVEGSATFSAFEGVSVVAAPPFASEPSAQSNSFSTLRRLLPTL